MGFFRYQKVVKGVEEKAFFFDMVFLVAYTLLDIGIQMKLDYCMALTG